MSQNRLRLRARMLGAVLIAVLLAACSSEQSSLDYLRSAQALYDKGERQAAAIELKNALEKNPANGDARYLLGVIYNETGFPIAAEKELRRAQQLRVRPVDTLVELGKALVAKGEHQKALDEMGTPEDPNSPASAGIFAVRGEAYLGLSKLGDAKAAFEAALRASPDYPDALVGLAKLRLLDRDLAGGGALVDRALAKSGKSVEAWLIKAQLLLFDGRDDEALAAYGEALKVSPFHLSARMSRVGLHLRHGRKAEAQAEVDAMRKFAKAHPLVHYMQALVHYSNADYAKAQESLQLALRVVPDYAPARVMMGAVSFQIGAYGQADQVLSRFVEEFPSSLQARRMLVATLIRTGQAQRALDAAKPLLEAMPSDPGVLGMIGEAYLLLGNHAKATEYLERGIAADPGSAALRTVFGLAKYQSGDTERALDAFATASAADAKLAMADYLQVSILIRGGRYDEALKALEPLREKQPKSPVPLELMAVAQLKKNDLAGARASLEEALKRAPGYVPAAVRLSEIDMRENRPDDARKRYEAMLAKDPKNIRVMAAMADLQGRLRNEAGMISWLEKARETDTKAVEPRIVLARVYLGNGKTDKAMPALREALATEPQNADALDLLGYAQRLAGDDREALATYQQLVRVSPRSHVAHLRLGALQLRNGDESGAEASFRRAIDLKPDDIDAKANLALLLAGSRRVDEALKLARSVQKEHPQSGAGFALEGDILMSQRRPKDAVKVFMAGAAVDETSSLALRLYSAQVQAGDNTAQQRLRQWVDKHPADLQARLILAEAYTRDGKAKDAIEQYDAVLRAAPDNVTALNNLANSLHEQKDPRALALAEKARALAPKNPMVADTYGWLLVESGQVDKGLGVLRDALKDHPDEPELHYHLAAALARSGDRVKARQELEALLQSGKRFQQVEQARALLSQLSR